MRSRWRCSTRADSPSRISRARIPAAPLGRRLLTRVRDVMRSGADLPTVAVDATLAEAIVEMSGKGMGMTAVVDADGRVAGIFTDGDLRRCLDRVRDVRRGQGRRRDDARRRARSRPTASPSTASTLMETRAQGHRSCSSSTTSGRLVGALHLHDLFRARIV